MSFLKNLVNVTALLFMVSAANFSQAATDGTAGNTSTGNLDINLTKGNEVRISNLQDVNFGGNNSAPSQQFIDVCVYSTTGSYRITASSASGTGNTFRMANSGSTQFITYDLDYNDEALGTSGADLNNSSLSSVFTGADQVNDDCGGGVNGRLFVQVSGSSFNQASSGSYSDTLTLVVSPQ